MTDRIDFALEPGVVIFAILAFVLINILLAAVVYPYFRSKSSAETEPSEPASQDLVEDTPSGEEHLEERVDEFLEDIHKGQAG